MVLMPFNDQCGISRKIEDPKERQRLRKILTELDLPEGMGIIIRTAGEGQKARFFVRDLGLLLDQWRQVEKGMAENKTASTLMLEPDLVERTVRDLLTESVDAVHVDDIKAAERMQELVAPISKRAKKSIHFTAARSRSSTTSPSSPRSTAPSCARSGSRAEAISSSTRPRP